MPMTLIYCSAATPNQALCQLQLAFDTVQCTLSDLKLVLNDDNAKSKLQNLPSITTSRGFEIETEYPNTNTLVL